MFTCSIIFWTDWADFYIGIANLDGSNTGMFAYVDYGWLNGLAIDYTGNNYKMCVHRILLKFPFKGGASQFLKLSLMKILLIHKAQVQVNFDVRRINLRSSMGKVT